MAKTQEETLVKVQWAAPCKIEDALRATGKGIYQIYGHHVVFGPSALLYVGVENKRTFGARFAEHKKQWIDWESDISIRLGTVADHADLLPQVESLTIFWHSPPYNSHHITKHNVKVPLRVQNWGDRGRLLPEYSNHQQDRQRTSS